MHLQPCIAPLSHANLAHLQVGVLIVGAGPTGLGAATRLHQLGYDNFLLIDKVLDRDASRLHTCY